MKRLVKQISSTVLIALSPIWAPFSKILAAPLQSLYGMMPNQVDYGSIQMWFLGIACFLIAAPILILIGMVVRFKKHKKGKK
jgi:hypothetical protein